MPVEKCDMRTKLNRKRRKALKINLRNIIRKLSGVVMTGVTFTPSREVYEKYFKEAIQPILILCVKRN
jgi:hypothetical protein